MNIPNNFYTTNLANGLRVVHLQHNSEVAYCGVMIKTGTVDERPEEYGMAHFLEHVLFKGTHRRKAHQVISRLERVGGDLNAYTSKEETFLYASFLKTHYERAIELLGDILFHSVFPAKELEKEKEVVVDEIYAYQDTPEEAIFDEFEERAFAGQPMGRNILGTPETVRSFHPGDVRRFVEKWYHPKRMVFVSIGAIDPQQLQRYLDKHFGPVSAPAIAVPGRKPAAYKTFHQQITRDSNQAHAIIGTQAYSYGHKRRNVLSLINNLLGGGGMTSRLNMSLREKHGYSYQVESSYSPYTSTGLFTIYFGTDRQKINKSTALVHQELDKLMRKPLGKQQLIDAKRQMIGQLLISAENKENILAALAKNYLFNHTLYDLQERIHKIEQITANQVLEVARELFQKHQLSTLVYE